MTLLLAAAVVGFAFAPESTTDYRMTVAFDGWLPVLGGRNAKASADVGVRVTGLQPSEDGLARASHQLTSVEIKLNDGILPFGVESMTRFFPKATATFRPNGEVVKLEGGGEPFPFRLPGLDAERFPEITYLPLVLPPGELQVGGTYAFKRSFGGQPVDYSATIRSITDSEVQIDVALSQKAVLWEDGTLSEVESEGEAKVRVDTQLVGKGTATFDRTQGRFRSVRVEATSTAEATELATGRKTPRILKITLAVDLQ